MVTRRSFRRLATGIRPKLEPRHFMLVHGAWHGAWCWYRTAARLIADGHRVTVLDLPAHGIDATAPATVTLEAYAGCVVAALTACDAPVILVGHSMGGAVISAAAEAMPAKIDRLVYLSAFLLTSGSSLLAVATGDTGSLATPNLIVKAGEGVVDINRDAIEAIFYARCPPEDLQLARTLLRPNPLAPFATPLTLTPANFGSVRRFYISCTRDQAITLAAQRAMYTATPCEAVYELHTDHSPFFSQPAQLGSVLRAIARA